ncbi:MAG TPA: alkaline phosphatase family protein [Enhygromyxa sp.]|nr:alkaline phosphatase family protein [Enhygromyxa sp.]
MRCGRVLSCLLTAALALGCESRQTARDNHEAPVARDPGPTAEREPEREPAPAGRPKLVVVIVVDQMRFDYFDRFGAQWQHGFARMREQGRTFAAAYHDHALTETAPGHATIATGTHPSQHGVVANNWLERTRGEKVEAVEDPSVKILGNDAEPGVSPASLLRDSVGDWMQAADPNAVVIAMAVKDRAAILLGGKRPDAALWYDDAFGGFTTSSYYADARPAWVDAYNQKDRAQALYGAGWTLSRADAEYGDSRRTTEPELVATFSDYALTKQFPHVIDKPEKAPRNVVRDTPFADQMTLELAREAIASERMGADEVPDLLLIGLSGGDYCGHRYGPDSVETHDYYLRMDEALGGFIADLDATLGKDEYVLILTADHGVAPMPEHSHIEGAGRFDAKREVPPLLEQAVAELALAQPPKFVFTHGVELAFDPSVAAADRASLRAKLAELLRAQPRIADAWTREELLGPDNRNEFAEAWRRSFHPERSSDLLLQLAPGVVTYAEGTGHGTPYEYDQHVPLAIRGGGWSGVEPQRVGAVDIAPTIAAIVGVPIAAGVDGRALSPADTALRRK